MRFFKSSAFKTLDQAPGPMSSNFVRWCEMQNQPLTHSGMSHYLGGFLGFASVQAMQYGDLKDAEVSELTALYEATATMTAVNACADGAMTTSAEFAEIVRDMRAEMFGFGLDPIVALGSFLEHRKAHYTMDRDTLGGPLLAAIKEGKQRWPGGPPLSRP